jgi:hypothetical protein
MPGEHKILFILNFESGIPGCYRRWDAVLDWLEEGLVTPSGYTIPIITAIGNHEAGMKLLENCLLPPALQPSSPPALQTSVPPHVVHSLSSGLPGSFGLLILL